MDLIRKDIESLQQLLEALDVEYERASREESWDDMDLLKRQRGALRRAIGRLEAQGSEQ